MVREDERPPLLTLERERENATRHHRGRAHRGTLARHFVRAGHEVAISNSRGPETLQDVIEELGGRARAMTAADAARFGEVVVLSIPFGRHRDLPSSGFAGKVVIDTNNYYPRRDGHFAELDSDRTSSSELLQRYLAGARVVKAFNSILWSHLRDLGRAAGDPSRLGIPISGDDDQVKRIVARLIAQIGFDAVDVGSLAYGRLHQPGATIYGADLTAEAIRARLGR